MLMIFPKSRVQGSDFLWKAVYKEDNGCCLQGWEWGELRTDLRGRIAFLCISFTLIRLANTVVWQCQVWWDLNLLRLWVISGSVKDYVVFHSLYDQGFIYPFPVDSRERLYIAEQGLSPVTTWRTVSPAQAEVTSSYHNPAIPLPHTHPIAPRGPERYKRVFTAASLLPWNQNHLKGSYGLKGVLPKCLRWSLSSECDCTWK